MADEVIIPVSEPIKKKRNYPVRRKPSPRLLDVGGYIQPTLKDIDNLPPVIIDKTGMPVEPAPVYTTATRSRWSEKERKIRFLMSYNYVGGIVPVACQEAGITMKLFKRWCEDAYFRALLDAQMEQVLARALLRLNQKLGLTPGGETIPDVSVPSLLNFIQKYGTTHIMGVPKPPEEPIDNPNIPRAQRPA